MHVAVSFRWPKKVLPVSKEVQVVVHVHPTGIGFCKYRYSLSGLAIGEIKSQLGLHARHSFKTQAAPIRQPFRTHDVFEWFVAYLDPGRAGASEFSYAQSHARIRASRSRVALSNHMR